MRRFFIEQTTGRVFTISEGCSIPQFFRDVEDVIIFEGVFGTGLLLAQTENTISVVQYVNRRVVYHFMIPFHDFSEYNMDDIMKCEHYTRHLTVSVLNMGWEELVVE